MKALAVAVLALCWVPGVVRSQTQSAPAPVTGTATQPADTAKTEEVPQTDRFPALWDESQRLQQIYAKTGAANLAEIDRLLRTKRCQINRVSGLLDRTMGALRDYYDAAKKYYEVWGDAETKRVEVEHKSLATMEAEKAGVSNLLDEGKKEKEALEQKEAALEQTTRTEEIRKQMDQVKQEILDSAARLKETQDKFESLSFKITTMSADLTKRLVEIHRYTYQLDENRTAEIAVFEDRKKSAQEVCDISKPSTLRTSPKQSPNP